MIIGVPRERKEDESRVALTPAGARELVTAGHTVYVERGAGIGSAILDEEFARTGAKLLDHAADVWTEAELICKVKEPAPAEYGLLSARHGQVLFTYLHLAASSACTAAVLAAGNVAIAYETVQLPDGSLPLLQPMSEVAGRMAPLVAAHYLEQPEGGRGVLISGVPGVRRARVVVLGAGTVGMNAVALAAGMHADVTLLDRDLSRLREADQIYGARVHTIASTGHAVDEACLGADVVIGAVLVVGARTPQLVSADLVAAMPSGSVLVDVSVDQGGCFAPSHPTTHSDPVFTVHGSVFYCVANMPGAVPHTSTYALANATLPYVMEIAGLGWREAARRDHSLACGVNAVEGTLTLQPVAEAHGLPWTPFAELLG